MDKLVSIIVPIYNVEKYVERCIYSIINQTYKNIEIILVDDGSTDNSGYIIEKLAKIDSRIKIIHKKNGGLSDARNYGINVATGDYLCFIDSDDYVNINFIKQLYDNLKETNSDISICMFKKVFLNDNIDTNEQLENKLLVLNKQDIFEQLYGKYALETIVAWNKIYKRKLFNSIKYPYGKIHEDEYVIHKLLNECNRIVYSPCKYYYYFQRENSIVHNFNEKRLDFVEAYINRIDMFQNLNMKKLHDLTVYKLCFNYYMILFEISDSTLKKDVYLEFKKYYNQAIKLKKLGVLRKIKLFILKQKILRSF